MYPKQRAVYTLTQILNELELRDSPFLSFWYKDEACVVQTSHFLGEDLLSTPGWAELRFTYIRETHEWIPIFRIVEEESDKLIALLTIEEEIDSDGVESEDTYWAVPKAFPREQYYADKKAELEAEVVEQERSDKELDDINANIAIRVIEDVHVGGSDWRIDFNNQSSVVVRDNFKTTPPSYDRVSGEFAANQIAAIERWSALKVNA